MAAPAGEADALSRRMRYLAIPLAGLFTTLFFVHLGFPYEAIVARGVQALEATQAVTIHYREVTSHLGLLGPGVVARGVVVSRPEADDLTIDRLILRPAWSTSWFAGRPAVHLDARMPVGRVSGAITLGDPPSFDGSFEGVDLAALPTTSYAAGLDLRGSLDADIEVHYDGEGKLTGSANISAEDGSVGLPGQPVAIPFDSFDAQLSLGLEKGEFLTIESAELAGPMISASASGHVAQGGSGPGVIDIELELAVVDEALQPMLGGLGIAFDQTGRATLQLGGTLAHPALR